VMMVNEELYEEVSKQKADDIIGKCK